MAYDLENKLVVAVSSRALFDLETENEIFEMKGLKEYYAKNGANRTLMPVQFGHPCRFKSDSDVGNDSDILE